MGGNPSLQTMTVAEFLRLPLEQVMAGLPTFLASYVVPEPAVQREVIEAISALGRDQPKAAWASLLEHMQHLGEGYGRFHRNGLAERIAEAYMAPLLDGASSLEGVEHLDRAMEQLRAGARLMIVGNHLSYADTMTVRALLGRLGRHDAVARLTAVAGPKVYSEPMRRLAVAGIHSIKVAQSSTLSTNESELGPREIMRISRMCMEQAVEAMDDGQIVLIYPEGTRSRTGRLQSFVRATNRWLTLPGVVLRPVALWGSEGLYLIDSDQMRPAECHARIGPAIDTEQLRADGAGRDEIMEAAFLALADLLPPHYRPEADAKIQG
ncbi:MAG: lysophospholipid acyltransferase family protein [Myxococcota bacterium]|nr:lysophospholipid acyltransferase family protein [Myxococcota bacterium]